MIVRELVALFGFQVDEASAQKVEGSIEKLKSFATKALVATAFVQAGRAMLGFAEEVAGVGDHLLGMSQQLGVSAKDLQEFGFIAEMANVSSEEMAASLKFLSKNSFEAATGNKELAKGFAALGVNVRGANGQTRPASDLLLDMSDAFSKIQDPAKKTALAVQLLGKSGATLIPFLSQGSDAIREQRKELADLGAVMSDDLIKASDEFSDNQTKMQKAVFGLKIAIGRELIPILNEINNEFIAWFKQNGATIRKALGEVARALGNILTFVSKISTAVLDFIVNLNNAQKALIAISAAIGLILAAISSPAAALGILFGLLFILIDDLVVFSKHDPEGHSMIQDFVDGFDELAEKFAVFKVIKEFFSDFYDTMVLVKDVIYSVINALTELGSKKGFWNTLKEGLGVAGEKAGIGTTGNYVPAKEREEFIDATLKKFPYMFPETFMGPPYVPAASQTTNTYHIQVDARGATDPEAVGKATGQEVRNVQDAQQRRSTGQDFKRPGTAAGR